MLDRFLNKYPYTDFHEMNLDWIIKHFKEFVDDIASLKSWRESHIQEFIVLEQLVTELEQNFEDFKKGIVPESWLNAFNNWLSLNMKSIIENALAEYMKVGVYFGLTDNGYFTAYIPETWKDIKFDTIMTGELYGHLTLSY